MTKTDMCLIFRLRTLSPFLRSSITFSPNTITLFKSLLAITKPETLKGTSIVPTATGTGNTSKKGNQVAISFSSCKEETYVVMSSTLLTPITSSMAITDVTLWLFGWILTQTITLSSSLTGTFPTPPITTIMKDIGLDGLGLMSSTTIATCKSMIYG